MLRLSSKWVEFFRMHAETGMGYTIVTVVLKDGKRYPRVAVTGGVIGSVDGGSAIPFIEDDIAEFEDDIAEFIVTHDKAGLRTPR
jgi:hypothetical protein